MLVLAAFVCVFVGGFAYQHAWYNTRIKGFAARSFLSAAIYEKSFRLSGEARRQYSSGEIANLAFTDTANMVGLMSYTAIMCSLPPAFAMTTVSLVVKLGWYALIGITFLAISVPLQARILNQANSYRLKALVFTDKRAKLLSEMLINIRLIKMFAWES